MQGDTMSSLEEVHLSMWQSEEGFCAMIVAVAHTGWIEKQSAYSVKSALADFPLRSTIAHHPR